MSHHNSFWKHIPHDHEFAVVRLFRRVLSVHPARNARDLVVWCLIPMWVDIIVAIEKLVDLRILRPQRDKNLVRQLTEAALDATFDECTNYQSAQTLALELLVHPDARNIKNRLVFVDFRKSERQRDRPFI